MNGSTSIKDVLKARDGESLNQVFLRHLNIVKLQEHYRQCAPDLIQKLRPYVSPEGWETLREFFESYSSTEPLDCLILLDFAVLTTAKVLQSAL